MEEAHMLGPRILSFAVLVTSPLQTIKKTVFTLRQGELPVIFFYCKPIKFSGPHPKNVFSCQIFISKYLYTIYKCTINLYIKIVLTHTVKNFF